MSNSANRLRDANQSKIWDSPTLKLANRDPPFECDSLRYSNTFVTESGRTSSKAKATCMHIICASFAEGFGCSHTEAENGHISAVYLVMNA